MNLLKRVANFLKLLVLLPWRFLTWLRNILANLLLLVVIVLLVAAYFSKEKPIAVPEKGALVVAPSGALVEQRTYIDPLSLLMQDENEHPHETLLPDLVFAIDHAATDKNITALVLDPAWLSEADPSKIFTLGAAVGRFKASGKPVFAIADNYTQLQYLLASYADQIYLNPMGAVELYGIGAYPNYFKDGLDKLKINVHVFRVGDYKSFVEPFMRNDMSEEARRNTGLWINDLWQQYTTHIEKRRKLESGAINEYIEHLDTYTAAAKGDSAQRALTAKLVDAVMTRDEMNAKLVSIVGTSDNHQDFAAVDLESYLQKVKPAFAPLGNKVGVIVAKGEILDGDQPAGKIGGDSLAEQIRNAREDDSVRALVLRIDSPGGSAFAAEIIRREIDLMQKAGKPVVASFGGVAASGGYWIASTADEIWATPSTITGSIGVFGMIPTFENTLDLVGVHSDGVGTTPLAGAMHLDRPMNPILERSVQLEVEHTYLRFLALAAVGRKTTPEKIHEVAQGQVWSGVKAKELGLVDHLGDLDEAIAAAAERAKLGKNYRWDYLEKPLSPKEEFFDKFISESRAFLPAFHTQQKHDPVEHLLAQARAQLAYLGLFNDPHGVYVRCLECVVR